jgi:hypothetical protein
MPREESVRISHSLGGDDLRRMAFNNAARIFLATASLRANFQPLAPIPAHPSAVYHSTTASRGEVN